MCRKIHKLYAHSYTNVQLGEFTPCVIHCMIHPKAPEKLLKDIIGRLFWQVLM